MGFALLVLALAHVLAAPQVRQSCLTEIGQAENLIHL
jgi:hypothetical protein